MYTHQDSPVSEVEIIEMLETLFIQWNPSIVATIGE